MRKHPTEAEDKLWQALRGRQLNGYKFRRQVPVGGYVLDFYCPQIHLGIELDGSVHLDPTQVELDRTRTQNLAAQGVSVIRFWNTQVVNHLDEVLVSIQKVIESSGQE